MAGFVCAVSMGAISGGAGGYAAPKSEGLYKHGVGGSTGIFADADAGQAADLCACGYTGWGKAYLGRGQNAGEKGGVDRMRAIVFRAMGIAGVMACLFAIAPDRCQGSALLWGSLMLTVLYTLIRPFIQTLILPVNLFLGGLLTPLTDALLVSWTAACVHGLSLGYWDGVLVSLAIGAAYLPYARRRRGREATLPS